MSQRGLQRLLAPRSLALIGGDWADAALAATHVIGYTGDVWRIHPTRPSSATQHYFRSVDELPAVPDAAFVAAPAREVPAIVAALATSSSVRRCPSGVAVSEKPAAKHTKPPAPRRASAATIAGTSRAGAATKAASGTAGSSSTERK